jgi:hypothetical protein
VPIFLTKVCLGLLSFVGMCLGWPSLCQPIFGSEMAKIGPFLFLDATMAHVSHMSWIVCERVLAGSLETIQFVYNFVE